MNLLRRRSWQRPRLDELRRSKLRRLIEHAYRAVPYYRRLFDRAGVKPEQIREPRDLLRIPVTTKRDLLNAAEDCLVKGSGKLIVTSTSGHTGVPFKVQRTPEEERSLRLREFRMMISVGIGPRDRLTLLGPLQVRPQRLHRRLGFYRLDVIPLTLAREEQLRRVRLSRPDVLWAYPTTLQALLDYAGCELADLARPRILITSAEVMRPETRERLTSSLPEMEIVNIYGSSEAGRIAAECSARRGLHLEDDALIVELLENGLPAEPGHEGTVVLTCLDQFAMPLIRYEQGDRCRLRPEPCSCAWQTPLIDPPMGRNADMLTLPGGKRISADRLAVSVRDQPNLLQYVFIQEQIGQVRAQLRFRTEPDPGDLEALEQRLREAAGGETAIHIELVQEIQQGAKFKAFVSKL